MLKYGMITVGLTVISMILWPAITGLLSSKPNEGTRLVEATERTNRKAESLNDSFTEVIPPAPAAQPGDGFMPTTRNGQQPENGEAAPGQQQPTPTPDKYAHASEHAVRDAMEYLNKLQTEMQPNQTEYIRAVEQLQRAWNPRYERAYGEYKRFARKIDHADAMAQEYFLVQQNLTKQINSPKDQRRAKVMDAAEREVYLDWRDQAFRTLGQAKLIMLDLHDMNIIITKLSLSSYFAALYEEFQTIPPAITMLHEELARFREESHKIQQTFGVPVQ